MHNYILLASQIHTRQRVKTHYNNRSQTSPASRKTEKSVWFCFRELFVGILVLGRRIPSDAAESNTSWENKQDQRETGGSHLVVSAYKYDKSEERKWQNEFGERETEVEYRNRAVINLDYYSNYTFSPLFSFFITISLFISISLYLYISLSTQNCTRTLVTVVHELSYTLLPNNYHSFSFFSVC